MREGKKSTQKQGREKRKKGEFLQEKDFEGTLNEYLRRGDLEKAKVLQGLDKRILPTQLQRIRRNDKSVLREMVLPNWLSWELLKKWAEEKTVEQTGKLCALCSQGKEVGVRFNDKFICEQCFKQIKGIPESSSP